jgi:DNA repair photolyase
MERIINKKCLSSSVKGLYVPKRIFVSESALSYARTQKIIERVKKLNKNVKVIFISTNTPPRPKLKGKALYNYLKESLVICERSAKYMEVFASPGNIVENISVMGKIHFHCPLQCRFCYLNVAGRGMPWTRVYVDVENFYAQAVKERFVYRMVQTLWSLVSFNKNISFDKVPDNFKKVCDEIIRNKVLRKRDGINSDDEGIKYIKNNLRILFNAMNIELSDKDEKKLKKKIEEYYSINAGNPLSINISEYSDVLALDHITNMMGELMQLVSKDIGFNIKFRTKAANVKNLLKYNGNNQVRVTFGLNTEYVINNFEIGSASLTERISAVNKLIKSGGYKIDLSIEPIIMYDGYENDYKKLVKKIKKEIDLSKIGNIKIGTVRYKTVLKNYIERNFSNSDLILSFNKLVAPEKGDKRWRYSKDDRIKIYSMIKDELKEIKNIKLGLGAEVPELWDNLGLDKARVHCNVVHQYENKEKKKVKLKK